MTDKEKTKYGQRGILKTRGRVKDNYMNLAEVKKLLDKHGIDVEIAGVLLPVPLITVDGVNHGITILDEFKFDDEK